MLGSINGYVLAKWKFRGSNVIFPLLLFGMFIPYQSILIPLVVVLGKIPWFGGSLYGTMPGLILAHVVYGIPITTLIFRNYYAGIPTELVEASRIDGANIFSIYRHILFPLSLPGFVVVMIWQFTSVWNDFLFAVTVIGDPADAADHRRAEQPGRQLHRGMERADGRGADRRPAHPGRVHLPGPLLHARHVGRVVKGIRTSSSPYSLLPLHRREKGGKESAELTSPQFPGGLFIGEKNGVGLVAALAILLERIRRHKRPAPARCP